MARNQELERNATSGQPSATTADAGSSGRAEALSAEVTALREQVLLIVYLSLEPMA